MKLAEALALRAEAARRIKQLRGRIVDNARYQEGEEPAEHAASLLAQTGDARAKLLQTMIACIYCCFAGGKYTRSREYEPT